MGVVGRYTETMKQNEHDEITEEEFKEFLTATGEERWKILLAHYEKKK